MGAIGPARAGGMPRPDISEGPREELDSVSVRGEAWFAYLRLYGPLPEPYFDKTWRVDQIE